MTIHKIALPYCPFCGGEATVYKLFLGLFLAVLIAALFACAKPKPQTIPAKITITHVETIPSYLDLYRKVQVLEAEAKSMKDWRERMWKRNPEMR